MTNEIMVAETVTPVATEDRYFIAYRFGKSHWGGIGTGYRTQKEAEDSVLPCDCPDSSANAYRIVKVCGLPILSTSGAC
jgi:hypothetical protein